jgi:hypothetical protein
VKTLDQHDVRLAVLDFAVEENVPVRNHLNMPGGELEETMNGLEKLTGPICDSGAMANAGCSRK